jgi:hypothetical protein
MSVQWISKHFYPVHTLFHNSEMEAKMQQADPTKPNSIEARLAHLTSLPPLQAKEEYFLKDTIQTFSFNSRAIDPETHTCLYYSPGVDGSGCAIGRWITDKEKCKKWDRDHVSLKFLYGSAWLPKELMDLHPSLLLFAQGLHDSDQAWDASGGGLSRKGKLQLVDICDAHGLDIEAVLGGQKP